MKNTKGFTLVELMIVLILLFFLAYSTFTSIRVTFRNKSDIDRRTEFLQEGRATLAILNRDLRLAYFVKPADFVWDPIKKLPPPDEGEPPPAIPPPIVTVFKGKTNEVFLSSRSHLKTVEDSAENECHFLTYQLSASGELIRAESKRAVSVKDRESPDQFSKQVLLTGVKKLKFEFFHTDSEKWIDNWDSEEGDTRNSLPESIRLELEYEPSVEAGQEAKVKTHVIRTNIRILESGFKSWPSTKSDPGGKGVPE